MLLRRAGTIANAEPNLDPGPALRMNQRLRNPRALGRSVGDLHHTLEFDLGSVPSLRQKFEICGGN